SIKNITSHGKIIDSIEGIIGSFSLLLVRKMFTTLQGDGAGQVHTDTQFHVQHLLRKLRSELCIRHCDIQDFFEGNENPYLKDPKRAIQDFKVITKEWDQEPFGDFKWKQKWEAVMSTSFEGADNEVLTKAATLEK
nr:protein multipolar spindle 1 isoform X1 [Tanacetum cinerariifolium]